MQQSMTKVKMEGMDQRPEQHECREPSPEQHWVAGELYETEIPVSEGPIGYNLVAGKDGHRDNERAKHVVLNLVFE